MDSLSMGPESPIKENHVNDPKQDIDLPKVNLQVVNYSQRYCWQTTQASSQRPHETDGEITELMRMKITRSTWQTLNNFRMGTREPKTSTNKHNFVPR